MRLLTPQLYLPLKRLALCVEPDCEAVFELGAEACPACGSRTWTTLARFLDAPDCRCATLDADLRPCEPCYRKEHP